MKTIKVSVREFRADLAEYIASNTPVAITRHGQTIGYFIPAQAQQEAEIAALHKAMQTWDSLLEAHQMGQAYKVGRKKTTLKPRK